jgi:hypothetical protein
LRYTGFPDPDRWRASKRLGGKFAASPRDLTAREHYLPWAQCSIPPACYAVKHARALAPTRTAADAVCSRAANAGSERHGPRPATAPPPVNRPHGAGDAGGPPNATALPTTASSADASRANAIASGNTSRPTLSCSRARASAQPPLPKNLRAAPATAPAATSSLSRHAALPTSISAPRPAARRYVASASVSSDARSDAAAEYAPGACGRGYRLEARGDVVPYFCPLVVALFWPLTPRPEEGAGGPGLPLPPVSFL